MGKDLMKLQDVSEGLIVPRKVVPLVRHQLLVELGSQLAHALNGQSIHIVFIVNLLHLHLSL